MKKNKNPLWKYLYELKHQDLIYPILIYAIYLILRLIAWENTYNIGEDSDSLAYISAIKTFLFFNFNNIANLPSTVNPFYPIFGALCSIPGWSVEIGARICSLIFSSILFWAVWGIGKKLDKTFGVAMGLMILCFSPILISLSYSILSESTYIGLIYLGLWLFLNQFKNPQIYKAGLLGIIFGLSFLSRTEGIIYIGIIPLFQIIYLLLNKLNAQVFKRYLVWTFVYVVCFIIVITPQIVRVSYKMGKFSINGRQVWSNILLKQDGKSYDEKIYGLDFSPRQVNLDYLLEYPEEGVKYSSSINLRKYIRLFMDQFKIVYQNKLGILIGPIGFIYFGFGVISLFNAGKRYEVIFIISFTCFNLILPMLFTAALRHMAVIVPLIIMVEGIGLVYFCEFIMKDHGAESVKKYILCFILFLFLIGTSVFVLRDETLYPPKHYPEYSLEDLKVPVALIKEITKEELHNQPVIVARYHYVTYYANGAKVKLPFTDYMGLVKYCRLNNADFLYLHYGTCEKFPFLSSFINNKYTNDFNLIYKGKDSFFGKSIEMYRVRRENNNKS